jgi:type IV secretory pathway VirB6-like protein
MRNAKPERTSAMTEQEGKARRSRFDERGEGVISAAIAVLVMAFLGVAMWVAFNATFQHAAKNVNQQVNCIGSSASGC